MSTTALHWLRPEQLTPLYRLLAQSGGPFLNGDLDERVLLALP